MKRLDKVEEYLRPKCLVPDEITMQLKVQKVATWLLILTQVYAISLAQFNNLFDLLYLGSIVLVLYYYLLARLIDPGFLS